MTASVTINKQTKQNTTCLVLAFCLALNACSNLTESFANLGTKSQYPAAPALNPDLQTTPPRIKLSHFQSPRLRGKQQDEVAIALAASGGGYRAANLTAGVMLGLEALQLDALQTNLLEQVDYYSTVSGGGFPVGLYLSYLKRQQQPMAFDRHPLSFEQAFQQSPYQFRKRLRKNLANGLFEGYRSALELEKAMSDNFARIGDSPVVTLADMFIPSQDSHRAPKLPMWISNATIVQSRQLFQFTPDVLHAYQATRYIHNMMIEDIPATSVANGYGGQIPAAVGMVASATYPYAIAGTTLWSSGCKKKCYLQLFDGGLVDNLGLFTALEVLQQDTAKRKVLIIIDAFQGEKTPFSSERRPPRRLALLQKILLTSADSYQRNMKQITPSMARNVLCASGAEQVVVVYLDLDAYHDIEQAPTGMWISESAQNQLIATGKNMVAHSEALTQILPQMLRDVHVAHC